MAKDQDTVPRTDADGSLASLMRGWLPPRLAHALSALSLRWPRVARVLTYVAAPLIVAVLAVQYGMPILEDAAGMLEPRMQLSLRAEPAVPGRLVGTVQNMTDKPIVVSGISVKVLSATPAPFRVVGEMDIPVAQRFSLILSPKPGMKTSAGAPFVMIGAKGVENIEMQLGSEGPRNLPWTRYELQISVDTPQESVAAGTIALTVPTARK